MASSFSPCSRLLRVGLGALFLCVLFPCLLHSAELSKARKALIAGDYKQAIALAEEAQKSDGSEEDWPLIWSTALLTTGQYTNAWTVLDNALQQFPFSIRLRLKAREAALFTAQYDRARELLEEIAERANRRQWAYRDAPNLIALGQAALLMEMDPKRVLDTTFDRAKKSDPDSREAHLASAGVALDKSDFDLAARLLTEALKKFPDDPDVLHGLARAYAGSDRKRMLHYLDDALEANPNHVPSFLLLVDHLVDAEEYEEAEKQVAKTIEVNPHQPLGWAYRAVMAHLQNRKHDETEARKNALKHYDQNPEVDHLIGRKLSQKYRFSEGSEYQRAALKMDPKHTGARGQLAQDLLRLGMDEEGWALAEEAHQADGYDVVAYNLATLKDNLSRFVTLTNEHFIVRMGPQEAPVYGDRVLALLTRAHSNLCVKYGITLEQPTIVEIFPDQKDFAVRTFGMPGGAGYLGVCFGRLITANSPVSQAGNPTSWESVLWHEFCHVVTLQMTRNKMPRWLSEGISVYEERQANPIWGQAWTPRYREMMLGEDRVKISDLSSAFMAPPTGEHLMFAYFQSAMVVEFLIEKYGFEKLRKILGELKLGEPINDTIARNTAPLDTLEKEFEEYALAQAKKVGPSLEWDKPDPRDLGARDSQQPSEWILKNPKNFYALSYRARQLVRAEKWQEAKEPLQELLKSFPGHIESGNAYELLAKVHRALKEADQERAILIRWAAMDPNAVEAYGRLMELGQESKDWLMVMENVQRMLAVNPLVAQPYAFWGKAAEASGKPAEAIHAYQTLLKLDAPDPSQAHYRLADLLAATDRDTAHKHVLQALEEAPRFRAAHELLLKLTDARDAKP